MLTFEGQYTQAQNFAQDTSAPATTFLKTNINIGQRVLETELGSFFTEETHTDLTEDGVKSYKTPPRFIRLKIAYVDVGSVRYTLENIHDEREWQFLQSDQASTAESDIPQKIIVRKDNFEIWPTPSTNGNTMTLLYEATGQELQFDDYTDGTIATLANGGTAVTGTGTTFTSAMAGRYFKINNDGVWYKIASFGTTTTLTLDKEYEGLAISGGSETYTIGQMPLTPEDTHHIPVYYAVMEYYNGFKQSPKKGAYYKAMHESEMARVKRTYGRRYSSKYIPPKPTRGIDAVINPNNYPTIT